MDSDFVSMLFAEGNANTLTCNCFISRTKNGRSRIVINMSVGHNNMCLYYILRKEWPTMGNV